MKKKLLYFLLIVGSFLVWKSCFSNVKETYIVPNDFEGFFSVLYQDSLRVAQLEQGDRVFLITDNGICISEYRFAIGPVKQQFKFENGKIIEDVGFIFLGGLTKNINIEKFKLLKNNPNKLYAIPVLSTNKKSKSYRHETLCLYFVGKGSEIVELSKNIDIISSDFQRMNLQNKIQSITISTKRLNEIYNKK